VTLMGKESPTAKFEDVTVKLETKLALLVVLDTGEEIWIPKSQIHADSEVYKKDTEGTLVVSEWFATKEGLV